MSTSSALAVATTVLAVAIVGCSATVPSSSAPGSDGPSAVPTRSPILSSPGSSSTVGRTEAGWGVIWDAIPADFPVFAGATIADDVNSGPASATFAIDDGDPDEIATYYQAALEAATYSTEAFSGPLEDGSYLIESVGEGDCRIATQVTPLGGLHLVTIFYGASCPAP